MHSALEKNASKLYRIGLLSEFQLSLAKCLLCFFLFSAPQKQSLSNKFVAFVLISQVMSTRPFRHGKQMNSK